MNPVLKNFVTAEGISVAAAVIPEDYKTEAAVSFEWQSEVVPSLSFIRAESPEGDISLGSVSKELFYDVRSMKFRTILSMIRNHTQNGYVPYMDAAGYVHKWAEQMAGVPLAPEASSNLPSILGNNPELARMQLQSDINMYDTYMGEQANIFGSTCESVLYKYSGRTGDREIVVLAGVDYQAAEMGYSVPLLGSLMGKGTDLIHFGSHRRYICITDRNMEDKATEIFLSFTASITEDEGMVERNTSALNQKISAVLQEASMNQAMAQQMHMRTLQMQQQTSQMIARNSQQVSAGIMDSWDKRQAAQSRMSTGYSEAVRGVNSYVTPAGDAVEMSVGADHVYQNKYGDTIGISGNDIDSNLASKLNWTKLEKK